MGNTTCSLSKESFHDDFDERCGAEVENIPVHLTKKRKAVIGGGGEEEPDYLEQRDTKKTPQEIEFLDKCCKSQMLFAGLDEDQRKAIIKQMYRVDCSKGTNIIVQGDTQADDFYVIKSGSFKIFVNNTEVAHFKAGKCFGELALMFPNPRAATVQANEDSQLFAVHRLAFRCALRDKVKEQMSRNKAFLSTISEFSNLTENEMSIIDMALVPYDFQQGEVILRQGEEGDKFYLIISGACTWTKVLPNKTTQTGVLSMGQYFGERALIKREKRAATITAKTTLKTLTLSKEDFHDLIGDGRMFRKRIQSYDARIAVEDDIKSTEERKTQGKPKVCKLKQLKTVGVLGQGAFGIVTLVVDPIHKTSYALKAIKKCQIVELKQQSHIVNEMRIMRKLAERICPFLVNLIQTYKDKLRVYFLLDVCLGGELFTILRRRRKFPEPTARFYTACVVEAFVFMHDQDIIYRDLKPENLVLNNEGYLKITDFGFAKKVSGKTFTLCGTPDYLAPEIVTGKGHGKAVDWWTLGILLYEMVCSFPPFYDEVQLNTYRKIIKGKPRFPRSCSDEVRSLVRGFLIVRAVKRLGMQRGGVKRIRRYPFFEGFDWAKLRACKLKAPIINKVRNINDLSNFEKVSIKDDYAKPVHKRDDFDDEF